MAENLSCDDKWYDIRSIKQTQSTMTTQKHKAKKEKIRKIFAKHELADDNSFPDIAEIRNKYKNVK